MNHKHLLLAQAHSYQRFRGPLYPEGCVYDPLVGAWLLEGTSTLYIDTPNHKRPRTKKEDIETGEDQKSE